jgi:hypothetical protein
LSAALVLATERIGEEDAAATEPVLELRSGVDELASQLVVGQLGQPRVGDRVRADLDTAVGELGERIERQGCQLVGVGRGLRGELAAVERPPVGGEGGARVDASPDTEPLEHLDAREHAAERVVERHVQELPGSRGDLCRGRGPVPAPERPAHLALDRAGRHRQLVPPVRRHGVVAEHKRLEAPAHPRPSSVIRSAQRAATADAECVSRT